MADKTTGELDPVKESPIGGLPQIMELYDDTLIPVEQGGEAMHMKGKQFADFARENAKQYVQIAVDAAEKAKEDADRAEKLRESIEVDYDALHKAVESAAESADNAKKSENASTQKAKEAADSESEAKKWAGVAEAEAERATVPAVDGVYNIVLTDRVTQDRYALIIQGGRLCLLGVSDTLDSTEPLLIDQGNGNAYAVIVQNGRLAIEEVS